MDTLNFCFIFARFLIWLVCQLCYLTVLMIIFAGLNNLGNTCFMSASLQCLFRTTPLVAYFLVHQYRYDINARSTLGSKGKLTEEFAK